MARRRHYRGLVKFPGLGFLPKVPSSVKPTDVAVGVALGLGGAVIAAKATSALAASGTSIPSIITDNSTLVAGLASAGVLYAAQVKKNRARAGGHAIGALLGAVAAWGYQMLQKQGALAGLVRFPGMGGVIMQNPRLSGFNGPIFANPNTNLNLGKLAALQGMGDENEDGLFPAP